MHHSKWHFSNYFVIICFDWIYHYSTFLIFFEKLIFLFFLRFLKIYIFIWFRHIFFSLNSTQNTRLNIFKTQVTTSFFWDSGYNLDPYTKLFFWIFLSCANRFSISKILRQSNLQWPEWCKFKSYMLDLIRMRIIMCSVIFIV